MNAKFFISAFLVMLGYCMCVSAKTVSHPVSMELTTPDGTAIILNPDSTWSFKNGKQEPIDKDFTVPLRNGKIIKIAQDQTWSYVKEEIVNVTQVLASDSVTGKGHCVNADVTAATDVAQKQALQDLTAKIKLALGKIKSDPKKLPDCIKEVQKNVVKNEDFKKGIGWEITVLVTVNKSGLLALSDCAKKTIDSAAVKNKK
ncbi:MAG: hypothetical protein WBM07_07690 [Chitinivibrionales bacterium]